ncbi:MAG: metallophosphoesterase [Myxococcota bacterium]
MGEHRISILHISDLHARSTDVSELPDATDKELERRRVRLEEIRDEARSWSVVTGPAWDDNLRELFSDGPPDLVCFTGDVADWGLRAEYAVAHELVMRTLRVLGVDASRLFVVPGNHDVQRTVNEDAWEKLRGLMWNEAGAVSKWLTPVGRPPRDVAADLADRVLARSQKFWHWVAHDLGRPELVPANDGGHGKLGYCQSPDLGLPFPVHIVGLDSAWLAGDNNDQGKLWLTRHQRDRLLTEMGKPRTGLRIALMHHPFTELAQPEVADTQRDLAELADLLLHGHQHESAGGTLKDLDGNCLRVLAAGCLYEGSEGSRWPNSCQRIDITVNEAGRPQSAEIRFRGWSRRAHWHPDASLYRSQTDDGRMHWRPWNAEAPVASESRFDASLDAPLVTADRFVGRTAELEALAEGLERSSAVAVTAIHGMPGVGKTFLTEHFAQLNADRFPGGHHRIGLEPDETRTAEALRNSLAAKLKEEPRTLVARLVVSRALVIIDNVDSAPLVDLVVQLWRLLPEVPLLVTGRYDELGRAAGWPRIELRPYTDYEEPLEQLAKEGVETRNAKEQADLRAMIDALGHLPLALSLAASHLRTGAYSPRSFIDELSRRGLQVGPADPSDPRRHGDHYARAVLKTSFEISWAHLRRALEVDGHDDVEIEDMLRGLSAFAYGLGCPVGPSLAAATAGLEDSVARKVLARAASVSLVQRAPGRIAWGVHPLIGDYLRAAVADVAHDVVRERVSEWFNDHLRRSAIRDDDQAAVRAEINDDYEALETWLRGLDGREAYVAGELGFDFAEDCGPYSIWNECYERAKSAGLDPNEESNRLWWLTTLAVGAGELDLCMRTARTMAEHDDRHGNDNGVALAKGRIADILQARGDLDRALEIRQNEQVPVFQRLGDFRSKAVAMGKIADVLQARGELDRALEIRRNEQLPVYERLGDVREKAVTMGKIADILQARGELDRALEIRQKKQVPVFQRLGDVRENAVTIGKIADILQARGELDRALEIRQNEQLPVYERLGDVHSKAVTMGRIADILQARGELDRALDIRQNEQLPVYEQLGDVRSKAVAMGYIADILEARGEFDRALKIRQNEELPVYERLGDVRNKAVTQANIATLLVRRYGAAANGEATGLLSEAYTAFTRVGLPEAAQVGAIAAKLGLVLNDESST